MNPLVAEPTTTITSTLRVEDMTCPDCARQIEKAVATIPGVKTAETNFGAGKLSVVHDPRQAPVQLIAERVSRMGYPTLTENAERSSVTTLLELGRPESPDCATELEMAVGALTGVEDVEMDFDAGKLRVVHDLDQAPLPLIVERVSTLGYKPTVAGANRHFVRSTVRVGGMECADCAKQIEGAVGAMPGVQKAELNFGAGKLQVLHDPQLVSLQQIAQNVTKLGYSVTMETVGQVSKERAWYQQPRVVLLLIAGAITVPLIVVEWLHLEIIPELLAQVLFAAAALIGMVFPARSGWIALSQKRITINTLLVVAAVGAMFLGMWEESALLVVIFSLGEVLEAYAVDKARGSIKALVSLAPREATVLREGKQVRVPTADVRVGEVVLVRPGEKVSVDGVVTEGTSAVDQSSITGESIPVEKGPGDEVFASTLNGRGALQIKSTKLARDTTLAKIIQLVEAAQNKKSSAQRFSEQFGQIYTPFMFVVAILLAVIPTLFFAQPLEPWLYRALVVLVVSCSCSLVLSVPVATVAGVGNAARHGILVKGGLYMETAGQVKVVAFDKTGTLTMGRPIVTDLIPTPGISEAELLQVAGALEARSEHPLAAAILQSASDKQVAFSPAESFTAIAGRGAQGEISGQTFYVGNTRLFQERAMSLDGLQGKISHLESEGKTIMLVGNSERLLGLIAVADQPKANARTALQQLKSAGLKKVVMLTGDNKATGEAIGRQVGVDEVFAELLPEDKIAAVRQLQSQYGLVAMVGDGINDAPALAQADVGIAMGVAGTDVSLETADITLMADDLQQFVYMVKLSRSTFANIKQNIVFSLITVAVLVTSALFGWMSLPTGVMLNEGSALVIIANGVRLLGWGGRRHLGQG